MPGTVFANIRGIAHEAVSPDACNTPTSASAVLIPHLEIGRAAYTSSGPPTVKCDGQMPMTKDAKYVMSTGDQAGASLGVMSSKIKGLVRNQTMAGQTSFLLASLVSAAMFVGCGRDASPGANDAGSAMPDSGSRTTLDASAGDSRPTDGRSDAGGQSCLNDSTVPCSASASGFTCSAGVSPRPPLVEYCPLAYSGEPGRDAYCCLLTSSTSTCARDPSVTCAGNATGYSCAGSDTPSQSNLIICGTGKAVGSSTQYCCRMYPSSSTGCRLNVIISGCRKDMYPFTCSGGITPAAVDNGLECGKGSPGIDNTVNYCCLSRT